VAYGVPVVQDGAAAPLEFVIGDDPRLEADGVEYEHAQSLRVACDRRLQVL
jgi:hypothetical protein